MVGLSSQQTGVGVMLKKSVGLCVGLMMIISGSVAMAHDRGGGKTKEMKSEASGTFVSANFDFDHLDLSTPANQTEAEGIGSIGRFTNHGVNEYALDLNTKTCTVPGGVAGAGTALTLVQDVGVTRIKATGDFLFFKSPPARRVRISPRSQRPPSRSPSPRQVLLPVARVNFPERPEPTRRMAKERRCPAMRRGCAFSAGSRIRP
jgi:hypothetical protein